MNLLIKYSITKSERIEGVINATKKNSTGLNLLDMRQRREENRS